jgi:ribosomal protein S11
MQKKKILNQKNSYKKKQKFIKFGASNKFKFDKNFFRARRAMRYKPYGIKNFNKIGNSKIFSHRLNIRVTPNNIFCSLSKRKKNSIISCCSSGKYKIKTSKKKLKYTFDLVLTRFFREIKKKKHRGLIILITSPIRIRKKIINLVSLNFKKKFLLIKVSKNKSFNGCRPPKKIRKKRRGLRILK